MYQYVKGILYLRDAYYIANDEAPYAISRNQPNIAARRAYESMEKSIKAIYCLIGEEPPKTHNPGIPHDFANRMPLIILDDYRNPKKSIAVIVTKKLSQPPTINVFKFADGTLTLLKTCPLPDLHTRVELMINGSTLEVIANGHKITSITDTMVTGPLMEGHWIQLDITETRLFQIKNAMKKNAKGRNIAFYHQAEIDSEKAQELIRTASSIFSLVKNNLGCNRTGIKF